MWQLFNKVRFFSLALLAAIFLAILIAVVTVEIPENTRLALKHKNIQCETYPQAQLIDVSTPLNIAVWNIYKQQEDNWQEALTKLAERNQLVLLQEAQATAPLYDFIANGGWHSNQAYAFAILGEIAGVMNLSKAVPAKVCAFTQLEPYLRLPKSALYSLFSLSSGQELAVINLHGVNFTYFLDAYKAQLDALIHAVKQHQGPIIIAGDFNTWSAERLALVQTLFKDIALKPVHFAPDERLKVFGHALDHIYYRGLTLQQAQSRSTTASDHAWLEAAFQFDTALNNK